MVAFEYQTPDESSPECEERIPGGEGEGEKEMRQGEPRGSLPPSGNPLVAAAAIAKYGSAISIRKLTRQRCSFDARSVVARGYRRSRIPPRNITIHVSAKEGEREEGRERMRKRARGKQGSVPPSFGRGNVANRHEWSLSRSFGGINETSLFRTVRRSRIEPLSIIRRFPVMRAAPPADPRRRNVPTSTLTPTAREIGRTCAPINRSVLARPRIAPVRYSARLNSMGGFLAFNRVPQGAPRKYRNISRRNVRGREVPKAEVGRYIKWGRYLSQIRTQ